MFLFFSNDVSAPQFLFDELSRLISCSCFFNDYDVVSFFEFLPISLIATLLFVRFPFWVVSMIFYHISCHFMFL